MNDYFKHKGQELKPQRPKVIYDHDRRVRVQWMIDYIDHLLKKNHIRMKNVLELYRSRLEENETLKFKHFCQLIPYLMRDTDHHPRHLIDEFTPIFWEFRNVPTEVSRPSTLEESLT